MGKRTIAIGAVATSNQILHTIPQAVDQICAETAMQIEATSKMIIEDAAMVSEKLLELAAAVREHGRIATEKVAAHCAKSKHTLETVARLQANLTSEMDEAHTEAHTIDGVTRLPVAPQLPQTELN